MQNKPGVHFVEVVQDDALKRKEELATAVFRQFFPDAPPVILFRTSDGQVGIQVPLYFSGNPKFDEAYQAVMKVVSKRIAKRSHRDLRQLPRGLAKELQGCGGPGTGDQLTLRYLDNQGRIKEKMAFPPTAVRIVYRPHIVVIDGADVTDVCLDRVVAVKLGVEENIFPPSLWFRDTKGKLVHQPRPKPPRRPMDDEVPEIISFRE